MIASKPIRIDRPAIRKIPRNTSEEMLSKSLGDHFAQVPLQRNISDISNIAYAGYLLKRSNHPYKHVAPFPDFRDMQAETASNSSPTQPQIAPSKVLSSSTPDSFDLSHTPQHHQIMLEAYAASSAYSKHSNTNSSEKESTRETTDMTDEQHKHFIESLFGVALPPLPPDELSASPATTDKSKNSRLSSPVSSAPDAVQQPRQQTKSAPIKMASSASKTLHRDNYLSALDAESSPECPSALLRSLSDCVPTQASDFIDPKDGHLWHAKYCVLEGGILYFYRHQADAELHEAQLERKQQAPPEAAAAVAQKPKQFSLAYSPVPTKLQSKLTSPQQEESAGHVREKRVVLDCVGAVRSAETEYGKNSFELSSADEDDDKLVLRAQDADQMNEWLFQFHRSIATFVMDIMDQVTPALGDIHHPTFAHKPLVAGGGKLSPKRTSTAMIVFSPRYHNMITHGAPVLSHGHGRNSLHRRRVEKHEMSSSVPPPDTPLFPMAQTTPRAEPSSVTPSPVLSPQLDFEMESSPELSVPPSACPEMERYTPSKTYLPPHIRNQQQPSSSTSSSPPKAKYVPPALRKKGGRYVPPHARSQANGERYVPRHLREKMGNASVGLSLEERAAVAQAQDVGVAAAEPAVEEDISGLGTARSNEPVETHFTGYQKLGGCADPSVIDGSILDDMYIPRRSSKVGKIQTLPFGYTSSKGDSLRWEIGAVSECGVRDSNEDSYLIIRDVTDSFVSAQDETVWGRRDNHAAGLFAIFDGHCGNEASRFAAEKLMQFIESESAIQPNLADSLEETVIGQILERAISSLDSEFCNLCVENGREWESGATALIAALVNGRLVIANLGDARGVMSRSVAGTEDAVALRAEGWNELPFDDHMGSRRCFWQEVTEAHSPNREDELSRIENANGWVTTEKEIPIGQLKRMVLFDQDVVDILKRCFADRYQPSSPRAAAPQRILQISRVCGELAVSCAIGDRDFKASYNAKTSPVEEADPKNAERGQKRWDCPLFLPYPDDHSRSFVGDLVGNKPDLESLRVGELGSSDEFLLLACDGLWDVIDSDDAIRVTRDLLFEKGWSAKEAAARLAELAIHLGSSDNVTVIVVRFFSRRGEN